MKHNLVKFVLAGSSWQTSNSYLSTIQKHPCCKYFASSIPNYHRSSENNAEALMKHNFYIQICSDVGKVKRKMNIKLPSKRSIRGKYLRNKRM
jgi:hypothetical protein